MVWCCVVLCGVVVLGMRKNPPCVRSKRLRVYRENAPCERFSGYTRRRLERTHGDVLNLHMERREVAVLFSSLFPLLSSLSSLSATMTMITRPVGSLCVHTALTCLSVGVRVFWLIPCRANMFASCKKQTCSHHARNNCPGFTMKASRHLE